MFFFLSELKALRYQRPELCQKLVEVKFDARGLKHHVPDHGITVIIPENAVATEEFLYIRIYDSGSIQFPASHRLVSEVFWIESSTYLQKNAELYVPHFVKVRNEEDSKKLSFFYGPWWVLHEFWSVGVWSIS